jgi:1,6-anhydro-N-acetylmuramate kinase
MMVTNLSVHNFSVNKKLHDLQGNGQDPSRTNPEFSDANPYSQTSIALSAFMTSPAAFRLTQFLKEHQRNGYDAGRRKDRDRKCSACRVQVY